ncbi:hypothetical protein NPIL_381841 [Nephila pilipes]|uniref:Uncharacterized protein n=1 Tax=Nephila pilipes TaxID=299642 RepID=A0A8X6P0C4_NEPPI|nr:hypothetical protein NPIL_381841 [Nephila pilipes]
MLLVGAQVEICRILKFHTHTVDTKSSRFRVTQSSDLEKVLRRTQLESPGRRQEHSSTKSSIFKTSSTKREPNRHGRPGEATRRTVRKKKTPLGTALQETGFKSVEEHRDNRFSAKLLREGERRYSETGPEETIRNSQVVSEEPGNQACSGRIYADRVRRAKTIEIKASQLLIPSPFEFKAFEETICRVPGPGPLGRKVPRFPGELINLLAFQKVGTFTRGGISEDFLPNSTLQACVGDTGRDNVIS